MDLKDYKAGFLDTNFWFKAKNDLIESLIIKKKNMKILDLGVGTGSSLKVLNKYGNVYATDINKEVLKLLPEGLYYEKKFCDARNIKYPSNYFDVIILFDVLEHIKESNKVIKEIFRVLKPGGQLLLTVPAHQIIYSSHDKALEHYKRFSKREIIELLNEFKTKKIGYWNFIMLLPISIMRLLNKNKKPNVDNMSNIPKIVDTILYSILFIENLLIKVGINLPLGLSIYANCRK